MKLPLLSTLAALAREHVLALTVVLLAAALAAGGFYGWRYYQYRQSSEYAYVRLQAALRRPSRKNWPCAWTSTPSPDIWPRPWRGTLPFLNRGRTRSAP